MIAVFEGEIGRLQLPFVQFFEVGSEYDDTAFKNILGDNYIIPGSKNLMELELTGFISEHELSFYSHGAPRNLQAIKGYFETHRASKKALKLVIADRDTTLLSIQCLCSLTYSSKESNGDIPFKIKVREYKKVGAK